MASLYSKVIVIKPNECFKLFSPSKMTFMYTMYTTYPSLYIGYFTQSKSSFREQERMSLTASLISTIWASLCSVTWMQWIVLIVVGCVLVWRHNMVPSSYNLPQLFNKLFLGTFQPVQSYTSSHPTLVSWKQIFWRRVFDGQQIEPLQCPGTT